MFEIYPQELQDGKYKLFVREFQEQVFSRGVLKKLESLLITAWAEVPSFAGERSEVFMFTVRICTFYVCHAF